MDLEIDINTDITISSKNTRSKHARGGTHLSGADHLMSMEQINIITPNAPNYDAQNMARNSSIQSLTNTHTISKNTMGLNSKQQTLTKSHSRAASNTHGSMTELMPPRTQKNYNRRLLEMNMFNPERDYFRNIEKEPSLLDVKVLKEDFEHLMKDDLDPISRNEVVYKILKS